MEHIDANDQHRQLREKLLQLAALRGSTEMSIFIESFVNRCMKVSRDGQEMAALNNRQAACIENEWKCLIAPTLRPAPVCNADGQWELQL